CGEAISDQIVEGLLSLAKGFAIVSIEIVPAVASVIHYDQRCHGGSPGYAPAVLENHCKANRFQLMLQPINVAPSNIAPSTTPQIILLQVTFSQAVSHRISRRLTIRPLPPDSTTGSLPPYPPPGWLCRQDGSVPRVCHHNVTDGTTPPEH